MENLIQLAGISFDEACEFEESPTEIKNYTQEELEIYVKGNKQSEK